MYFKINLLLVGRGLGKVMDAYIDVYPVDGLKLGTKTCLSRLNYAGALGVKFQPNTNF